VGTLPDGNVQRLIAPLYSATEQLISPPPTGFFFFRERTTRFICLWLDWRTLLDIATQRPEVFTAGLSIEQQVVRANPILVQVPLQTVVYHQGGQGIPIKSFSLWAGTLGIRFTWQPMNRFTSKVEWGNYYLMNAYQQPVKRFFKKGQGWLSQLSWYVHPFILQLAYWKGEGFSSENLGNPLYQSMRISNNQVVYQEKHRRLLLFHIGYIVGLRKDLSIGLHVNPYYDLIRRLVEHEAGLYVRYNPVLFTTGGLRA
jgi:hypothetical protein